MITPNTGTKNPQDSSAGDREEAAGPLSDAQQANLLQVETGLRIGRRDGPCSLWVSKAFLVAVAIWIVVVSLGYSLLSLVRHGHLPFMKDNYQWRYNFPQNIDLDECPWEWLYNDTTTALQDFGSSEAELAQLEMLSPAQNLPFTSSVSYDFPLSDLGLIFQSRGGFSAGNVDIVTSPGQKEDTATYHVVAHYSSQSFKKFIRVCRISYRSNSTRTRGVGVYTPEWINPPHLGRRQRLFFETTIILPESTEDSSVVVKQLLSDTINTSHRTSHLSPKVFFENVHLNTTNAPVLIYSLNATKGSIHTVNAPIRGVFNVTDELDLVTSNAPIKVAVGLTSKHCHRGPSLSMNTKNGAIESDLSLFGASGNISHNNFSVTADTTNSPIAIQFATAPVDSKLTLVAETTNSPSFLALHPTYEGSFEAQTSSVFQAEIKVDNTVEDPSGADRERKVTFEGRTNGGYARGRVVWGDEKKQEEHLGSVKVATTNSPVTLKL